MSTLKTPFFSRFLFVVLVILTALVGTVLGQATAARPDRGMTSGASYSVSDVESISLTNGNLNLSIPLASLPPIAGGKLKLTLNAIYNSKLWNVTRTEQQQPPLAGCPSWVVNTPQLSPLGGWRIGGGYSIVVRNAHEDFDYVVPDPPGPGTQCETNIQEQVLLQNAWYRTILISPDGAEHELRPIDSSAFYNGTRDYLRNYYKDTPNTLNTPMRYYSFDGTFLWATINPSSYSTVWTIYLNDGTKITQTSDGVQRISDTNGNSIKIFTDAAVAHFQDEQTGREIKYTYDAAGNGGQGQGHVLYQTVTGIWQSIDINWGTTLVQGKLYQVDAWNPMGGETGGGTPCHHDVNLQTQIPVIRQLVFPATEPGIAGKQFAFAYNSDTTDTATDQATWFCGTMPQTYTRTVSKATIRPVR